MFLLVGIGIGTVFFQPKGRFVVGINAPFPPFESYNDTTGTYEGFDVAIAQLIADAMGRELVIRNFNDFGVLLETVKVGGVDMAASAITMSGSAGALRNQSMSFSDPYYSANQAVIIRSGYTFSCTNNVCTIDDIVNNTIGVQSQTTSESWVDQYITPIQRNPGQTIHRYASVATEVDGLRTSVYDLMIIDEAPARAIVAGSNAELVFAGVIITNELYGFPVQKGDPHGYLPAINSVIARIKSDGTYNQLLQQWFK